MLFHQLTPSINKMQDSSSIENLESSNNIDVQEESRHQRDQQANLTNAISVTPITTNSIGYYDAEKCRAYIANQIKVSKIDRFAAQVGRAIEVEASNQSRLDNIMNMFECVTAQVAYDFTLKCKFGFQRHQQDRILNQQRKPSKNKSPSGTSTRGHENYTISNDLLYGTGVQLIYMLLSQITPSEGKKSQRDVDHQKANFQHENFNPNEADHVNSDLFEPDLYVKKLEDYIKGNQGRSKAVTSHLTNIRQLFEKLATKHRDKVDLVYGAEEERQAATVTRRSAYNLSIAAIKATSTPIHVKSSNEIS